MFLFSLLCAQMQRSNPRPVLPVAQTLMFPRPTFVGDGVAAVLVLNETPGRDRIALDTSIRCVQRGRNRTPVTDEQVTAQGDAVLLVDASAEMLAEAQRQEANEVGHPAVQPAGDRALYHLSVGQEASAIRSFSAGDIGASTHQIRG